jgi:hypothetical protein
MRSRPVELEPKGQRIEKKKTPRGRKPKGYKATAPGQCGVFDTVEYFLDGMRRTSSRLPIITLDSPLPGPLRAMLLWLPGNSFDRSRVLSLLASVRAYRQWL